MTFSLRRLLGSMTVGCVALGAAISTAGRSPGGFLRCVMSTFLAIQFVAAIYVVLSTCRQSLRSQRTSEKSETPRTLYRRGGWAGTTSIAVGIIFMVVGGFGAILLVDNNLTMDGRGASAEEWARGAGLIIATTVGAFARGASLVGFLSLLFFESALVRRWWVAVFGICGGSLVGLLVWRLTGDIRGVMAGNVSNASLFTGCLIAWFLVPANGWFGHKSRRWGAYGFLLGLLCGVGIAIHPTVEWMLFWHPPMSFLVGVTICSGLGAIAGMLFGVELHKTKDG